MTGQNQPDEAITATAKSKDTLAPLVRRDLNALLVRTEAGEMHVSQAAAVLHSLALRQASFYFSNHLGLAYPPVGADPFTNGDYCLKPRNDGAPSSRCGMPSHHKSCTCGGAGGDR